MEYPQYQLLIPDTRLENSEINIRLFFSTEKFQVAFFSDRRTIRENQIEKRVYIRAAKVVSNLPWAQLSTKGLLFE